MTENVYAPPQVDSFEYADALNETAFYVVSMRKFTVLFFATFGLYYVYWFFTNWRRYKFRCQLDKTPGRTIWPLPRALFPMFFVHSLFLAVAAHAAANKHRLSWMRQSHAALLVVMLIAQGVIGKVADRFIGPPAGAVASLILLIAMYLSFGCAQQHINISCSDPKGMANDRFTWANYLWIVPGTGMWVLMLAALVL